MSQYSNPPGSTTINTGALAVGVNNGNMLVAFGATWAWRIIGFSFVLSSTVTAATLIIAILSDGAGNIDIRSGLGGNGNRMDRGFFPYPGIQAAINTTVTWSVTSTVAGGNMFITCYTYVDSIT
jgi:hypothetical protein